ncbi:MAG: hypothetical protein L3J35_12590 [Bacteroidales bacterium]|nr:hypothetical protein [Bacteroidales bacterium]
MKCRFIILLSFVSLLICCEDSSTETVAEFEETAEDKAIKAVEVLPEYKEANIQINAMTNGEQSISLIIDAPTEEHPEFYIQAGYNQESWFEPYYIFVVDAKTFEVYIEDVIEEDVAPIETWREREKHR